MIFVIEHSEPELFPWCLLEYAHMANYVEKQELWFTNIQDEAEQLTEYGKVFSASVKELNLSKPCILDPAAPVMLSLSDASQFEIGRAHV